MSFNKEVSDIKSASKCDSVEECSSVSEFDCADMNDFKIDHEDNIPYISAQGTMVEPKSMFENDTGDNMFKEFLKLRRNFVNERQCFPTPNTKHYEIATRVLDGDIDNLPLEDLFAYIKNVITMRGLYIRVDNSNVCVTVNDHYDLIRKYYDEIFDTQKKQHEIVTLCLNSGTMDILEILIDKKIDTNFVNKETGKNIIFDFVSANHNILSEILRINNYDIDDIIDSLTFAVSKCLSISTRIIINSKYINTRNLIGINIFDIILSLNKPRILDIVLNNSNLKVTQFDYKYAHTSIAEICKNIYKNKDIIIKLIKKLKQDNIAFKYELPFLILEMAHIYEGDQNDFDKLPIFGHDIRAIPTELPDIDMSRFTPGTKPETYNNEIIKSCIAFKPERNPGYREMSYYFENVKHIAEIFIELYTNTNLDINTLNNQKKTILMESHATSYELFMFIYTRLNPKLDIKDGKGMTIYQQLRKANKQEFLELLPKVEIDINLEEDQVESDGEFTDGYSEKNRTF